VLEATISGGVTKPVDGVHRRGGVAWLRFGLLISSPLNRMGWVGLVTGWERYLGVKLTVIS